MVKKLTKLNKIAGGIACVFAIFGLINIIIAFIRLYAIAFDGIAVDNIKNQIFWTLGSIGALTFIIGLVVAVANYFIESPY